MTANDSLDRRLADFYESEAPARAPDWVLRAALETIDTTPQRRVVIPVPWRISHMNTYAKMAIAAVVLIAIAALGLSVLGPPSLSSVGGPPTVGPSVSPSISVSPSPAIRVESPPPLTETFTSERYGFSISYPTGWVTRPATDPWTAGFPDFSRTDGDVIHDPIISDHLWIMVASQPLAGKSGTQWVDDMLAQQGADCGAPIVSVSIVGGEGKVCTTAIAAASAGERGYVINLYTSGDDPAAVAGYDQAFFNDILATLQLRPDDAVDSTPSPSA